MTILAARSVGQHLCGWVVTSCPAMADRAGMILVRCGCRAALDESRINAAQAVEKHARRALRQTLMKAATEHASECCS